MTWNGIVKKIMINYEWKEGGSYDAEKKEYDNGEKNDS